MSKRISFSCNLSIVLSQNINFFILVGVLEEAEFYNITELIKLVKQRVTERDEKQNQVCN